MLSLIASSPQIRWGVKSAETNMDSPFGDGNIIDQETVGRGKEEAEGAIENSSFESNEMMVASPDKCGNADVRSYQGESCEHNGRLTTSFICVVGALQRMTVNVPDKSNWRTLVLNSILRVLRGLQTVSLSETQEEGDGKVKQINLAFPSSSG